MRKKADAFEHFRREGTGFEESFGGYIQRGGLARVEALAAAVHEAVEALLWCGYQRFLVSGVIRLSDTEIGEINFLMSESIFRGDWRCCRMPFDVNALPLIGDPTDLAVFHGSVWGPSGQGRELELCWFQLDERLSTFVPFACPDDVLLELQDQLYDKGLGESLDLHGLDPIPSIRGYEQWVQVASHENWVVGMREDPMRVVLCRMTDEQVMEMGSKLVGARFVAMNDAKKGELVALKVVQ
jgi:hypothetical protein